jgi:hypothetical protein
VNDELFEVRAAWAEALKKLRETGEEFVLNAIANTPISFTRDSIIVHAQNESVMRVIETNRALFPPMLVVKLPKKTEETTENIEQRLAKLFGERITFRP